MVRQKRLAVVLLFTVVVIAGCVSAGGVRSQDLPAQIVIFVQPDGTAMPDPAYVADPSQEVVWISCSGVPEITFENKAMPKPLPDAANHRARLKIPPGHRGSQPYSASVKMASGETMKIDPIIIVQY